MKALDLRVVLTRTIYERNIGAASRAMSNMGFHKLILVDPKCEITYEAQQAAATGQEALQNRIVYSSWEEFYAQEPEGLRIALSARDGRGRAVRDLGTTLRDLLETSPQFQEDLETPLVVHFIFGPEDWGLAAEDLKLVNYACSIPTFGPNASLNLAQAVLLTMFIVRENWGGSKTVLDGQQPDREQLEKPTVFPDQTLKTWLEEMGFDLSKKKINAYTVLRRMLLQNTPTPKEYLMLETVLQQSLRKLREWKELKGR